MTRIRTRRQLIGFPLLLILALAVVSIDRRTPLFCRAQEQEHISENIKLPETRDATSVDQHGETSSEKTEVLDRVDDATQNEDSVVENSTHDATTPASSKSEETQTKPKSDADKAQANNQDNHIKSGENGETITSQQNSPLAETSQADSGNYASESSKDPEPAKSVDTDEATSEEANESDGINSPAGGGSSSFEEPDENTIDDVSQEATIEDEASASTDTTNTAADNTSTTATETVEESKTDKTLDDNKAQTNDSPGSDSTNKIDTGTGESFSEETAETPTLRTNETEIKADSQEDETPEDEPVEKTPENPSATTAKPAEKDYFDLDEDDSDAAASTGSSNSDQNPASAANDNPTSSTPPSDSKAMREEATKDNSKTAPSTGEEHIGAQGETNVEEIKKYPPKEQEGQNLSGNSSDVKDEATKDATTTTTTSATEESTLSSDEGTNDSSSSSTTKPSESIPYQQPWGQFTGKKYADLHILGLTFNKNLAAEAATRYRKLFEPLDLVIPKLYTKIMGKSAGTTATGGAGDRKAAGKSDPTADPIAPPLKERLSSPNADFVEGLDDIDKFFEEVDPPDELDVGAGGTSIQDVLMGQTTKIVIKRVVLGAQYVSRTAKAAAKRIHQYFSDNDDDAQQESKEAKFPKLNFDNLKDKLKNVKFDKEQLKQAGKWTVEQGKNIWSAAREFFDDIFGGEDELVGDEFASLQKRLQEMAGDGK